MGQVAVKEQTDAYWVAETLSGSADAFSHLVRKYQDYAYGVAVGALSDFDLARDVVQEAFLSAYCDLGKLKDRERFGGWLRGIVRHTAFRALREMKRVRVLAEELGGGVDPYDPAPAAGQHVERTERRAIVRQALSRLNEKNREAVSLHYIHDLSYAEIAGFLGITKATVLGRLQRGRAQLRKELDMVEKTFGEEALGDDFAEEIRRLLNAAEEEREHQHTVKALAEMGASAVDPLCVALDDSRQAVRKVAAYALCHIGDARASDPLWRALYVPEPWLQPWRGRLMKSGRLLSMPGLREKLMDILREGCPDWWERRWLYQTLGHAKGDDEVFDCVHESFLQTEAQGWPANTALEALCAIRPEATEELLLRGLHCASMLVRAFAALHAVRKGITLPIDDCLNIFVDGAGWWGLGLAGELILRHGDEGLAVLRGLLDTGTPAQKVGAAIALARFREPQGFEILKAELLSGAPTTKNAQRVIAQWYGEELLAWIESDPAAARNHDVAWALARCPSVKGASAMETLYREGDPVVRIAAMRVLARDRGAAFLPELRECLRRGKPGKLASDAFWLMHGFGDQARPIVEEMLGSEHWTERKAAVCLLRRWGSLSEEQKTSAKSDPHVAVRQAAG